jgi:hypothetical protein
MTWPIAVASIAIQLDTGWTASDAETRLVNVFEACEHAGMATFYKPSQWRGKRRIYRSADPDEPKQEIKRDITIVVTVLAAFILFFAATWFFSR